MPATVGHVLTATTPDNPAYEIKPSNWNSNHAVTLNISATEISALFGNSNGVSFGTTNGSITASHNGLTTAALSNHSHGNPTLNLTNLSGTTASNSAGFTLSLSANAPGAAAESNAVHLLGANTSGNTTATGSTIGWSGINLTLSGTNGSQVVVSGPGTSSLSGTGALSISANGSTVSLGVPNLSIYASSNTTGQSSSSSVSIGSLSIRGMGGLSVGMSAGELILSGATGGAGGVAVSAGANSVSNGTVVFSNSNGVTFGLNGSTVTASHNGLTTARASTDAIGLNTAGTNVTWTVNSSGLSLNAAGYAGTGTTFNGANISGSLTQNSNGIQMSLSVAAPGAAAENNAVHLLGANTAGNTTATGSTIGWSGINATLSGTNNSQVVISVPATSSLVGSSGLSISTNGSTITAYAVAMSEWNNIANLTVAGTAIGNSLVSVQPFQLDWPLVISNVLIPMSVAVVSTTNNSSAFLDISASGVVYTRNASTLSSLFSFSQTATQSWSSNATASAQGGKQLTASFAGTTLTPGQYFVAFHVSTTNSATGGANTTVLGNTISMGLGYAIATGVQQFAAFGAGTSASSGFIGGLGIGSSGATRASWDLSAITVTGTRGAVAPVAFQFRNATYQ